MKDKRYTITLEFCGYSTAKYVARFCGDWLGCADTKKDAVTIAKKHKLKQFKTILKEAKTKNSEWINISEFESLLNLIEG